MTVDLPCVANDADHAQLPRGMADQCVAQFAEGNTAVVDDVDGNREAGHRRSAMTAAAPRLTACCDVVMAVGLGFEHGDEGVAGPHLAPVAGALTDRRRRPRRCDERRGTARRETRRE